jgi:hypothetical protein
VPAENLCVSQVQLLSFITISFLGFLKPLPFSVFNCAKYSKKRVVNLKVNVMWTCAGRMVSE